MNIFLKILSRFSEKFFDKAYVEFPDGKFRWAHLMVCKISHHNDNRKIVEETKWRKLTKIYSADGKRIVYEFDSLGFQNWYDYGDDGKLKRKIESSELHDAHDKVVNYFYDKNGSLSRSVKDENGCYAISYYNEKGLVVRRDAGNRAPDPHSVEATYEYDSEGNLTCKKIEGNVSAFYKVVIENHDGFKIKKTYTWNAF